jgi:7,8-dihydropterin-6-yl-methyl-4-(beta-D-ribofuranosyl)aminobenzene 5'-phosphate synthase
MKKLKVLYDKDAVDKRIKTGWGFSVLVEENILFDTGEDGGFLMQNMEIAGVDTDKINKIVISHDHWDHTGGLWELLKKKKGDVEVYGCKNFQDDFKEKVKSTGAECIEVDVFREIEKNICTTGEIEGEYKGAFMPEQGIVLKTENGVSLITGCAHPGIFNMVSSVMAGCPGENIYLVAGGFHLLSSDAREINYIAGEFKKAGIKKVGPTHCSGPDAEKIFKEFYGENYIDIKAGIQIEL